MFDYEQESEIERMLKDDIREQKRTGNGIHGRALRLRKHETVRTPSESLTGIERKIVMNPSVLRITTVKEIQMEELLEKIKQGEIPPKSEFEALDFESSQKALAELRRLHTNFAIMKNWKCSSSNLSSFFEKMQVAKSKKGNSILIGQAAVDYFNKNKVARGLPKIGEEKERIKRPYNRHVNVSQVNDKEILSENTSSTQNFDSAPIQQIQQKEIVEIIKEVIIEPNYLINIKRNYKTEQISGLLERLAMFLSEDAQEFLIEIRVTEIRSR